MKISPVSYTHLDVYKRQQYALKDGGGDPEPLGNGDVIFHGLGDGMTAHLSLIHI